MEMKIGEVIRQLRKKQDVTQEKLADYLGISYQAISKWENGTALPDITLVPKLASFFNVSTDELFSVNEQINDEKVKWYLDEYQRLGVVGDVKNRIELMRKALDEYPRNYQFMVFLAGALSRDDEGRDEAIQLCEKTLEDCTEDHIRHCATQILCIQYPKAGKKDKAIELAARMPTMCVSSQMLMEHIYEGDEKIERCQYNLLEHILWAAEDLWEIALCDKTFTSEQKIKCLDTANALYKTIFPDGDYMFYSDPLFWNYYEMAKLYCNMNNCDSAIQCLKQAVYLTQMYDNFAVESKYSEIWLNHIDYTKEEKSEKHVIKRSEILLRYMQNEAFDPLRDNPEFTKLQNQLKEI